MTTTPFSEENKSFTDAAHLSARSQVYPKIFGVEASQISYEKQEDLLLDKRWQILDGQMGIDQLIKVSVQDLRHPLPFTVQERFREMKYQRYKDITITENNGVSGALAELYKLQADYFLYGYFNPIKSEIADAVLVPVSSLKRKLVLKSLGYTKSPNYRSSQQFISIKFDDLQKHNLLEWRLNPTFTIVQNTEPNEETMKATLFKWLESNNNNELMLKKIVQYIMGILIKSEESKAA